MKEYSNYKYTLNIGDLNTIKLIITDIKREIESNTIIVGDFSTPLISMDGSFRQKINKETVALHSRPERLLYSTFYPEEYIFFSSGHGIFSRIVYMLGHKTRVKKFQKIEIMHLF